MLIAPAKPQPDLGMTSSRGDLAGLVRERQRRRQVVILGGGFAGLSAARALAGTAADIVVVDRCDYHLFQPLLYQVATANLLPADIAAPIGGILGRQANTRVIRGEVSGVDKVRQFVLVDDHEIFYDYLVVATGSRQPRLHQSGVEWAALGLKTVGDALVIRDKILLALEQAAARNEAERRRLLTFVVIGAGTSGVELAAAVAELVRRTLERDFRDLTAGAARVVLVDSTIRVLPAFAKSLSSIARRSLQGLGVELRLGAPVSACDGEGIVLAGKRLPSATVLRATGVAGSPAAGWLGAANDLSGRVFVAPDLSLPSHPNIFAIGDTAHIEQAGRVLPGLASVAKRQGLHVGRTIAARISRRPEPGVFHYRSRGSLVALGSKSAVAQFGPLYFSGRVAWLLWAVVHICPLIGFRNPVGTILGWVRRYIGFGGARPIVARSAPGTSAAKSAPDVTTRHAHLRHARRSVATLPA